jgi:hypothetical protein
VSESPKQLCGPLRLIFGSNIALALGVAYLYIIYGRLHWWFIRVRRQHEFASKQDALMFWDAADQIHMLCICFALLLCLSNAALWRATTVRSPLVYTALAASVVTVLLCVFVVF